MKLLLQWHTSPVQISFFSRLVHLVRYKNSGFCVVITNTDTNQTLCFDLSAALVVSRSSQLSVLGPATGDCKPVKGAQNSLFSQQHA